MPIPCTHISLDIRFCDKTLLFYYIFCLHRCRLCRKQRLLALNVIRYIDNDKRGEKEKNCVKCKLKNRTKTIRSAFYKTFSLKYVLLKCNAIYCHDDGDDSFSSVVVSSSLPLSLSVCARSTKIRFSP